MKYRNSIYTLGDSGTARAGSFSISRGFISLCSHGTDGFVWENPGSRIAVLLFPATSVWKMSKIPAEHPQLPAEQSPPPPCPCQAELRVIISL